MRRALLVVVACALAFVAGRSIPRAAPGPAPDVLAVDGATPRRGPDEAGAPASLAAAPVATTGQPMTPAEVPLPRGDVVVKPPGDPAASAESRVPPAWLDAVRAEPTRANHV